MPNALLLIPVLACAVVVGAKAGPTASQLYAGKVIFSDREVPAPRGSSADYIAKIRAASKTEFKYGSGHKFRLHYALYPLAPARMLSFTFTRVMTTSERDMWTYTQPVGWGQYPIRNSFEVTSTHVPVGHYEVTVKFGHFKIGSGSLDIAN